MAKRGPPAEARAGREFNSRRPLKYCPVRLGDPGLTGAEADPVTRARDGGPALDFHGSVIQFLSNRSAK